MFEKDDLNIYKLDNLVGRLISIDVSTSQDESWEIIYAYDRHSGEIFILRSNEISN